MIKLNCCAFQILPMVFAEYGNEILKSYPKGTKINKWNVPLNMSYMYFSTQFTLIEVDLSIFPIYTVKVKIVRTSGVNYPRPLMGFEGQKTKARQKIQTKKIKNENDRLITFSKHRSVLLLSSFLFYFIAIELYMFLDSWCRDIWYNAIEPWNYNK